MQAGCGLDANVAYLSVSVDHLNMAFDVIVIIFTPFASHQLISMPNHALL
jgi:hypothetical protein